MEEKGDEVGEEQGDRVSVGRKGREGEGWVKKVCGVLLWNYKGVACWDASK